MFAIAKLFVLLLALSSLANAEDQPANPLTPQNFALSLQVMKAQADKSYIGVSLALPTLDQTYGELVSGAFNPTNLASQNLGIYPDFDLDQKLGSILDDAFGIILYTGAVTYDNLKLALGTHDPGDVVPYGYCDAHPEVTQSPCNTPYASALYAFIVRSVANKTFIDATCDSFISVYVWHLKLSAEHGGHNFFADKTLVLGAVDRLEEALLYLENNGQWDVSDEFMKRLKNYKLGYSLTNLLTRRHLDSGPAFVTPLRTCLAKGRARLAEAQ